MKFDPSKLYEKKCLNCKKAFTGTCLLVFCSDECIEVWANQTLGGVEIKAENQEGE